MSHRNQIGGRKRKIQGITMLTKEEHNLITMIEKAIQSVINDEIDLLKKGRIERTFTSSFATHLNKNIDIENIRIDPFYNKHNCEAKRLDKKIIELDIAVHKRDTDENNLVAIEIETNNTPTEDDLWKIKKMTIRTSVYHYELGLYIVFGVSKRAGEIITKKWYKNGVEITL
jgi:hypothetical protein